MRTTWDAKDQGINGTVPHCLPLPADCISSVSASHLPPEAPSKQKTTGRESPKSKGKGHLPAPLQSRI